MNVSVRVRVHVRAHVGEKGDGGHDCTGGGRESLHARAAKKIKLINYISMTIYFVH